MPLIVDKEESKDRIKRGGEREGKMPLIVDTMFCPKHPRSAYAIGTDQLCNYAKVHFCNCALIQLCNYAVISYSIIDKLGPKLI